MASPASTPVRATRVAELRKKYEQRHTVFCTPEEMPTSPYFNRSCNAAVPLGAADLNVNVVTAQEADFGAHKSHAADPGPEVFEGVGTRPVPKLVLRGRELRGDYERDYERDYECEHECERGSERGSERSSLGAGTGFVVELCRVSESVSFEALCRQDMCNSRRRTCDVMRAARAFPRNFFFWW